MWWIQVRRPCRQSQQQSLHGPAKGPAEVSGGNLPAGLRARVGVARAVGRRPLQGGAEMVGVGPVINGAEEQARLVP